VVAERRFGPLIVLVFLVLAGFVARLFQVQVLEHEVWAGEAASLVKSSQLLASRRGRILDREGRVFVEDEAVWRVDFVYRNFRRENPLGIVAHARSTLEMRCVPLEEALSNLVPWGLELARLSLADLEALGRTGALSSARREEASPEAMALHRSRASDLRYYLHALLDVTPAERRRLRKAGGEPAGARPLVESLAEIRGTSGEVLLESLAAELGREHELLASLEGLLPPAETKASLVSRMEAARARFEDAAADALFEEATGFPPGRISTASLTRAFDLRWLGDTLRWDAGRLEAWRASRRAAFQAELEEYVAPRLLVRAGLDDPQRCAERLLDGLASVYAPAESSGSWRDLDDLSVLEGLSALFELPRSPDLTVLRRPAIPLLDQDLRRVVAVEGDPWLVVGTLAEMVGARLEGPKPAASAREWAERFSAIADKDPHLEGGGARAALLAILSALENRFLGASDAGFEACLAAGATSSTSPPAPVASSGDGGAAPLPLARECIDRARQKEKFLLRDLSSRPVPFAADASYPLVHLLERHADKYGGFEARASTRRKVQVRGEDGVPLARGLIGGVRGPSLRDLLAREEDRRSEDGEEESDDEPPQAPTSDDRRGSHGVEALFDADLRGKNGWLETTGLGEEASATSIRAAVHGRDVVLTLDRDLQLAAQETLAHPQVPRDANADTVWLAHPVGAIVLITPDGEVLAAASEPTVDGLPPAPGRDLERTHARERTLTRPVFNPPGSVLKPFVAAYAIDRIGLDPREQFPCGPLDDGGWGYEDRYGRMHCHRGGHGQSDLAQALSGSCNAAFAQIGERCSGEQLLEMAEIFGFGRPTGIRDVVLADGSRRRGLREEAEWRYLPKLPKDLKSPVNRMRFANGLSLIEATPMQVARATAGLLTGKLPGIRIARSVADEAVLASSTDLPISSRARQIVLDALRGVVDEPGGTAHGKGLDRGSLGFAFVCKTGSADTWDISPAEGGTNERKDGQKKMRKQTWIAGWFPEESPRAILVVMLHDVLEVSSYSSVYIAGQFLRSEAVKRFLERDG